ncbi:MAG TPA: hypothetical protein ENI90_03520 [Methylothermaceae bacterium]|nr:hypothetical protein [Methylothermaceae bacterium]
MRKIVIGAALIAWSGWSPGFEVFIQGKRLVPERESQTCIKIAGEYPGIRIEANEIGKEPQICFSDARRDIISLHNVTLVATEDGSGVAAGSNHHDHSSQVKQPADAAKEQKSSGREAPADSKTPKTFQGLPDVVIKFSHTFPPGPNGYIMARAKIAGFFATPTGLGVASGNHLRFVGIFSQGGAEDMIAEPFELVVGEAIDSAIFESKGKKRYLIAGPRTLKGKLVINFAAAGHKLTLTRGATISIDRGARFEDKLEEVEQDVDLLQESLPKEAPEEEEEFNLEEELQL